MKPASIISLIVAAVIIIAGIVTCTVASNMAEKNGNLLFAEVRGDDYVKTVDLSDKEVNRISLDFADADVNIYGSSRTSYIEFVNFRETLYSLSVTNTSVMFSEIPDLTSILRFWENGFSFKGMRYILNPRTYDDSKIKCINIYLADGYGVKQFSVTGNKTTVTLENLSCDADYIITSDELTLSCSSVNTMSVLRVDSTNTDGSGDAKLSFVRSSFGAVEIDADTLDISGETNGMISTSVKCKNGTIDWSIPHYEISAYLPLMMNVETTGSLHINNEVKQSPFAYDNTAALDAIGCTVNISAGEADVSLDAVSFTSAPECVPATDAVIVVPAN